MGYDDDIPVVVPPHGGGRRIGGGGRRGEGLATAFTREHRLNSKQRRQEQEQEEEQELHRSDSSTSNDAGDETMESKKAMLSRQGRSSSSVPNHDVSSPQQSTVADEDVTAPAAVSEAADVMMTTTTATSAVGSRQRVSPLSHPPQPFLHGAQHHHHHHSGTTTAAKKSRTAPPPLLLPFAETLPLHSVTSLDDFQKLSTQLSSPLHFAGGELSYEFANLSPRVGLKGQRNTVLTPRPLHLKPEFTHPVITVAPVELNPTEISTKFLVRYGRGSIQWSRVRRVTCTPFHEDIGLSEATLYHCVLDIMSNTQYMASETGGGGGGGGVLAAPSYVQYGTTSGGGPTGTSSGRVASLWRKIWFRVKTVATSSEDKQRHRGGAGGSGGGGGSAGCINGEEYPGLLQPDDGRSSSPHHVLLHTPPVVFLSHAHSLNNVDLYSDRTASSQRSSGMSVPCPPQFLVIKHYDTSVVDTPNMVLRLARHLTATTAEKMVSHEIFFYSKLSSFYSDTLSPFRCPKAMFIAKYDRGDPGLCRYVCCGTGSGTIATIGLEDMQRSGFSFDHSAGEGLFDEIVIYSVLIALAYLHSSMWDRCHEPALQGLEPAAIILFVHRANPKIQHLRSKNEFSKLSPRVVCTRWTNYAPTAYLGAPATQTMIAFLRHRWDVIRSEALEIISRRDTVLHGDVHYKNLGFRTKYTANHHQAAHHHHQHRRDGGGGGSGSGKEQGPAAISGGSVGSPTGMMHRYFSLENLLRQTSETTPVSSLPGSKVSQHRRGESSDERRPGKKSSGLSSASAGDPHADRDGDDDDEEVVARAKQSAESIDLQPCFLDYQSCGPGSMAAELLYFICTSIPVEVDWHQHSEIVDVAAFDALHSVQASGGGSSGGGTAGSPSGQPTSAAAAAGPTSLTTNSFAGLSPPTDSDGVVASTLSSSRVRSTSLSSGGNPAKMALAELLSFDVMLITTYFQNLDPQVQVAYPLPRLIHDVYILARHWAGCVFFDLATAPPEERAALKRLPQYQRLISWGEKTAERVMAMCVAVFTEVDGRLASHSPATSPLAETTTAMPDDAEAMESPTCQANE